MKIVSAIKIGLIAGIMASVTWYVLASDIGNDAVKVHIVKLYVLFGTLFVGIPFTVFWEKKSNEGILPFAAALKNGMLFSVVIASVLALFNYIFHEYLLTDMIPYFLSEVKQAGLKDGKNIKEITTELIAAKNAFNSYRIFPPAIFVGLILSLLSASIFQKSISNEGGER